MGIEYIFNLWTTNEILNRKKIKRCNTKTTQTQVLRRGIHIFAYGYLTSLHNAKSRRTCLLMEEI